MVRSLLILALACGLDRADFMITGNPATDMGWNLSSHSLGNGEYVRGSANFAFNIYNLEFRIPTTPNPLSGSGWNAGDRIVGLGGVFTTPMTPADLGYPTGTVFTGPGQNALLAANTRFTAKFGANAASNIFSPSTLPPASGNGLGSHSGGNGGVGSVQVSITSGRFTPGNEGLLITPTTMPNSGGSFDNVAQYVLVGGTGANGIDLNMGSLFPSARYIYNLDSNGLLESWEVLLNATLVSQYPNMDIIQGQPTGGRPWILSVQAGTGAAPFTDGLTPTNVFIDAPAPPAIYAAIAGGFGLLALRRRKR